jgi:hypothetical protein
MGEKQTQKLGSKHQTQPLKLTCNKNPPTEFDPTTVEQLVELVVEKLFSPHLWP